VGIATSDFGHDGGREIPAGIAINLAHVELPRWRTFHTILRFATGHARNAAAGPLRVAEERGQSSFIPYQDQYVPDTSYLFSEFADIGAKALQSYLATLYYKAKIVIAIS
jgi:hypothetical protein